jgi:hypothetical protein
VQCGALSVAASGFRGACGVLLAAWGCGGAEDGNAVVQRLLSTPQATPAGTDGHHWACALCSDYGFDPLGLGKDPASLARFQEAEIIHCRWAMLGAVRPHSPTGPPSAEFVSPPTRRDHTPPAGSQQATRPCGSSCAVALMDRGPCVDHLQAGVIAVEALGYGDWLSAATSSTQTYFGTPVRPAGCLVPRYLSNTRSA